MAYNKQNFASGNKLYASELNAMDDQIAALSEKAQNVGLPVLYLTGEADAMDKDTAVELNYTFEERTGTCTVKWQGSSSLSYPKKNYSITFDSAFEAKSGWGSHDKYCLKANWVDASHMRNILCARLWGEMVKSRSDKDTAGTIGNALAALPNGGAIDGFPIVVNLNGEAQGLYTMNIPKDGWMFGMTGANSNEAIVCAENSGFYNTMWGDGSDVSVEYTAADTDEAKTAAITSLNALASACMDLTAAAADAIGEDELAAFKAQIEPLVDIPSLIDYYIFSSITQNSDGLTRNYILATFDGTKWFMSAYDMDATFGNSADGASIGWYNDQPTLTNICDRNRLMFIVRKCYMTELRERWKAVSGWTLNVGNFTKMVSNLAHEFPVRAFLMDWELWPSVPGTNANHADQIENYHRQRFPVVDWEISDSNTGNPMTNVWG